MVSGALSLLRTWERVGSSEELGPGVGPNRPGYLLFCVFGECWKRLFAELVGWYCMA